MKLLVVYGQQQIILSPLWVHTEGSYLAPASLCLVQYRASFEHLVLHIWKYAMF